MRWSMIILANTAPTAHTRSTDCRGCLQQLHCRIHQNRLCHHHVSWCNIMLQSVSSNTTCQTRNVLSTFVFGVLLRARDINTAAVMLNYPVHSIMTVGTYEHEEKPIEHCAEHVNVKRKHVPDRVSHSTHITCLVSVTTTTHGHDGSHGTTIDATCNRFYL